MGVLSWLVANCVTWRVYRRFPPDERLPRLFATFSASLIVSVVGLALGVIWSGIVEMIRLSDLHLSYRAFYLPYPPSVAQKEIHRFVS